MNPSKCTMMVKLEGTQAQRALRRFTYWRTAPNGQRQKMWRLGQAKSHEGFPSVTSFKYLGVMLSYGNFEKATLKHRLQEGNAKLQQVRRFVHNRRTAGPRSRLHIWHSTVWATVSSGLVVVGLTEETAALLRAWHAKKIRAVLNCPAHLTHKSTSDLYRAHDIVDPVLKLQKRHANRVKRLLKRHRLSQMGDVALAPPALEQALFLRGQYQSVIAQLDAAATPAAPASLETCPTCNQQFETKVGLRTHIARKHPETVQRYIPRTFSHLLSVDGLPQCAACRKRFPQMKGLKDHLLSGACSAPAELRALDDQAQPTTASTSSLSGLHPRQQRLHSTLQTHTAVELGREPASRELLAYCLICGFWTHDHGKLNPTYDKPTGHCGMHTESKRLPTAAKLAWCCSKDNLVLAVKSMYTTKDCTLASARFCFRSSFMTRLTP